MDEDAAQEPEARAAEEPGPTETGAAAPTQPSTDAAAAPSPPEAQLVAVEIGEDGEGQAFVGLDIDHCSIWNPPADCSVGITPAHTVGISRVLVSGATPGSTVNVTVLPK